MAEIELLDSPNRPAQVPRRFGVGVPLILMTGFAVLFACLSAVGASPVVFGLIAGLITAVSIGQVVLFEGKRPRTASVIAGTISLFVMSIGAVAYEEQRANGRAMADGVGFMLCSLTIFGPLVSYAVGVLVSGVFLLVETNSTKKRASPGIELRPMTAADLDLLLAWLQNESTVLAWTNGRVNKPFADIEALGRFLELPPAENSDRLCFKAVAFFHHEEPAKTNDDDDDEKSVDEKQPDGLSNGIEERIVGYIELTHINRAAGRAHAERAIVDPDAPQRPQVSLGMMKVLLDTALGPLGLSALHIHVPPSQVVYRECVNQLWKQAPSLHLLEKEINHFVLWRPQFSAPAVVQRYEKHGG